MDMNIKGVEKAAVMQFRTAALLSGVSLKDWVMNVLTQAVANKVDMASFQKMDSVTLVGDFGFHVKGGSKEGPVRKRDKAPEAAGQGYEGVAASVTSGRVHDPKTCRVYKCGLCSVDK